MITKNNIIKKILNIGIEPQMEVKQISLIKITNTISLFTSLSCLLYFGLNLIFSEYYLVLVDLIFCLSFALTIIINYFKKYFFANLYLIILINIFLTIFTNLLGKQYSIEVGFVIPISLAFIFFGTLKKNYLILSITISIICYLFTEVSNLTLFEQIDLNEKNLYISHYTTVIFIFTILIIILQIFVKNIEKAENELKTNKQDLENIINQRTLELQNRNQELIIAKAKAEANENHILNIINNLPIIVSYIDRNITYQFVNHQYEIWFNKTKENIVGKRAIEIIDSKAFEKAYPFIQRTLNGEKVRFENVILKYNEIERYMQTSYVPNIDTDNNVLGFYVLGIDTTEDKKIKNELTLAKEKAEENNQLKNSFLQNMSHEVRTPLNAIVGFSQLLKKCDLKPEKLDLFLKLIEENSNKLINIISDVIEISQIHAKQLKINISETNIIEFLQNIIVSFKDKAQEKSLKYLININIDDNELKVWTDIEKLKKLISHLIDNAIKFTSEGYIEINCKIENQNLLFSITDTGIGISPETQNIVFEPFRQLENGTTRNYGGNGLGLAIVKSYIELLNGTIILKSEINKGTNITVSIPILKENLKENNKITKNIVKTILIVDDEQNNYEYFVALFENINLNILHAVNGSQAVDLCRNNNSIDLILMDIKMPIMDGYTATKLIKEFRKDIPIIAQTAYVKYDKEEEKNQIFDDYIVKPISSEQLFNILEKFKVKSEK